MPGPPLSPATRERLEILFRGRLRFHVEALLVEQCGDNLPFMERASPADLERVRFAALKVSGGSLAGLREAISLAQVDWRDLLVGADFAHDVRAHESWMPEPSADTERVQRKRKRHGR